MHPTRKTRLVQVGAALALCQLPFALWLLPRAVSAQSVVRKKSVQASEPQTVESFYAEDFTRDTLGTIPKVDKKAAFNARVTPTGNIVVTGDCPDVWVPPGKFVQLDPDTKVGDYKPIAIKVMVDGNVFDQKSLPIPDDQPLKRIGPPEGVNRKRVVVVAYDQQGQPHDLMKVILRARVANPTLPTVNANRNGEKCRFDIKDGQTLTARHLYLSDLCVGRVEGDTDKIDMDERLLPPGKYTCQMIGQNADDVLVPGPSSEFEVPARYDISCKGGGVQIVIPEGDTDAKLEVTVKHRPDVDIKTTYVSIGGIQGKPMEGENFNIQMPMRDVPSGKTAIEVIGVGADGTKYPVESLTIDLKNGAWWTHVQNTAEYQRVVANDRNINKLQREIKGWLAMADCEPEIFMTKKTYTLSKITEHYARGEKGKYMANAKMALFDVAKLQIDSGVQYRELNMRARAAGMFRKAVLEMGDDPVGADAQKALDHLYAANR